MISASERHQLRTQLGSFNAIRRAQDAKRKLQPSVGARLSMPSTGPADPRPPALNREPCPRCNTRGDLGCPHQQPFTLEAGAPPDRVGGSEDAMARLNRARDEAKRR